MNSPEVISTRIPAQARDDMQVTPEQKAATRKVEAARRTYARARENLIERVREAHDIDVPVRELERATGRTRQTLYTWLGLRKNYQGSKTKRVW